MPHYRVPVLLWQDFEGAFTAAPVESGLAEGDMPGGQSLAAVDATAGGALEQIKDFLQWQFKQNPWSTPPDFLDPVLFQFSVSIRPEYEVDGRSYPCDEEIELLVHGVHGHQESGLVICSLPTMSMGFHVYEFKSLRRMAGEAVRRALARSTPQELSRYLPPKNVRLEQVSVHVPRSKPRRAQDEKSLATLNLVAQPVGHPGFRKRFSAAWQREEELADLVRRLAEQKANVILLGEPGVGKTTLLVNAVRAIERSRSEDDQENQSAPVRHRYWQTAAARLIAGMKYLGQWQERCEQVIDELAGIDGVLCVEALLDLVRLGGSSGEDSLAAFLLPYLKNGELRMVAEATPSELDACRRLLPGFAEVFTVLQVNELEGRKARAALAQTAELLSRDSKITIEEGVTENVYRLFRRFQPYRALPGAASRFLNELFDEARQNRSTHVSMPLVLDRFTRQTGLPDQLLRDDRPLSGDEVFEALQRRIIGQPEACRAAAALVTTFKAGLHDPGRPIGTLLFCGPTGVGKTELAKTLSRYLFGHGKGDDRLVRLDMSEYSTVWTASRLIAKDDQTPSDFIQHVRAQPFVVVLLDEIEKAAPEVFDILLSVLDEGRLTDRFGRTTTFRSAILIMTSNLGSTGRPSIGFARQAAETYQAAVRSFFRPEFCNRIDAVVTFQPLDQDACRAIARLELDQIGRREGLARARLRLTFSDELVAHLVQEGFDARYGARHLQRTLETRVVSPLSRYLVERPGLYDRDLLLDLGDNGALTILR